jgi:hypothetical protein
VIGDNDWGLSRDKFEIYGKLYDIVVVDELQPLYVNYGSGALAPSPILLMTITVKLWLR